MITQMHQYNQPLPIIHDSRGTIIKYDLRVAYNRSGNIVLGNINKINTNKWKISRPGVETKYWWSLKFEMIVEDDNGKLTTIKNPNSFVII